MDASPKSMSKAAIVRRLNEMIDYHLYNSETWPADEGAVSAFWRTLEQWGLTEMVPGQEGSIRYTALGIDCGAPMASYFIGAHEPMEVPMMLESRGLIDEHEVDAFYSSEEDEREIVLHTVAEMVRRSHRIYCGLTNEHIQ